MNTVILNRKEATKAAFMGVLRRMTNIFGEVKQHDKNIKYIGGTGWSNDIEAAGAELAFAKFINEEWVGSVNTFHAPDVGDCWQVRYTDNEDGRLIIRKRDESKRDHKFVLITGAIPKYYVHGYILGKDGFNEKYIFNPNNGTPAYFIPKSDLIKFNNENNN